MQKSCYLKQCSFSSNFYDKKVVLNIISLGINFHYIQKKQKNFEDYAIIQINFWSTVNKKEVFRTWRFGSDTPKGKRKSKFYIHIWSDQKSTFWKFNKLTIVCSETPFSKSSYYVETVDKWYAIQNSWLVSKRSKRYFQTDINPFPVNVPFMDKPGSWFLLVKCVKKTWKQWHFK